MVNLSALIDSKRTILVVNKIDSIPEQVETCRILLQVAEVDGELIDRLSE